MKNLEQKVTRSASSQVSLDWGIGEGIRVELSCHVNPRKVEKLGIGNACQEDTGSE